MRKGIKEEDSVRWAQGRGREVRGLGRQRSGLEGGGGERKARSRKGFSDSCLWGDVKSMVFSGLELEAVICKLNVNEYFIPTNLAINPRPLSPLLTTSPAKHHLVPDQTAGRG